MKKLLLIIPVLIGHTTMMPLEEASKLSCQKVKEIATSKPACMVYAALAGLSAGAGSMYLLHRRAMQAQEKLWQPGYQIAKALEEGKATDITKIYFDAEQQKNIEYGFCDLEENINAFVITNHALKNLKTDIKNKKTEEAVCYAASFKRLYEDLNKYNAYLRLNGKEKWQIALREIKQGEAAWIIGVEINPPSDYVEQERMWQAGSKVIHALEADRVGDVMQTYFKDITKVTHSCDEKNNRIIFELSDEFRKQYASKTKNFRNQNNKTQDPEAIKKIDEEFMKSEIYKEVVSLYASFDKLYADISNYNDYLYYEDKPCWEVKTDSYQDGDIYHIFHIAITPPKKK